MIRHVFRARSVTVGFRVAGRILRAQYRIVQAIIRVADRLDRAHRTGSPTLSPMTVVTTTMRGRGFWTFGRRMRQR